MSLLVVIIMASLALVSQAYPHSDETTETLHHHDHHHFLAMAAKTAVSMADNRIDDELEILTPSQLMSCISIEDRKRLHHQCHGSLNQSTSMASTCFLEMIKEVVDNATGAVDTAMLELLTIEPTSLTDEQKILASGSLKSCIESNFTFPLPSDVILAAKNITIEEFMAKYGHENGAMRIAVCVAKALLENGCSGTSPLAALVIAPVNLDDQSSSEENSSHGDDDQLVEGIVGNPLA